MTVGLGSFSKNQIKKINIVVLELVLTKSMQAERDVHSEHSGSKIGETQWEGALTYALLTERNNQWQNRHDRKKTKQILSNHLLRTPLTACFPSSIMLSRLQKWINQHTRTQDLWFSCYLEHLWVRPMWQCLIMVKPNMCNVWRNKGEKKYKEMLEN